METQRIIDDSRALYFHLERRSGRAPARARVSERVVAPPQRRSQAAGLSTASR